MLTENTNRPEKVDASLLNTPKQATRLRSSIRPMAMMSAMLALMSCTAEQGLKTSISEKPVVKADASDTFFASKQIPELRIEISEPELDKLKADPRKYVRCTIHENDNAAYPNVAVKLKGAAGSMREWDDKPALTLNVSKFEKGQTFHKLTKFHLNNSVQDETYLQEWLCADLLRRVHIPATRVSFARVKLNDRDVGLYVLKEGFDKSFLKRHFSDPEGNLYDGGFVQDIDAELEKDSGSGPNDRNDLIALTEACREPNLEERWKRIDELLDVDEFITFMAMELMMGHWDGYTANRNNYRLYFDPSNHKAHFLPHGMDQMFGDPNASILDPPGGLVAQAVMENPDWRATYRQRIGELLPHFSPADELLQRVDQGRERLRPIFEAIDPAQAQAHADRVNEFKDRLIARAENLRQQNELPDPKPMEFDEHGRMQVVGWNTASESDDAVVEEVDGPDEKRAFSITCGPSGRCIASWRRKVSLPRGAYALHAKVRSQDVEGISDEKGQAAGLRISGSSRENSLSGTSDWQELHYDFTIEEDSREVELIAELRATRGQAWFEIGSLILERKPNEAETQ